MMKQYFSLLGIILSVISLSALPATKGYSDDLFKANLTGSSLLSYGKDVEAKVSIKDNGKVELSVKGLRTYPDNKLVNQNSVLVIKTEINESSKTYSKSFTITDGKAEEEFTLEDLSKDDKLEITSVVINKDTTTPTPTATASATPTSSPTATSTASPTPTSSTTATPAASASPTPTGTTTSALAAAVQMLNASTSTDDTILVPGGIISESTTAATPTPATSPTATASPTSTASPTETPSVIEADVSIQPKTINLNKKEFKAFITFSSSSYSVENINPDSVECSGAPAVTEKSGVDKHGRFVAVFRVQDLDQDLISGIRAYNDRNDKKRTVELTVSGELTDGTKFEGSDTVSIKGKQKGNNHDGEDGHGKHR